MDANGVLVSHDFGYITKRDAAVAQSIPWDAIMLLAEESMYDPDHALWQAAHAVTAWLNTKPNATDVPMLRRMIDGMHKTGSESIEEIVRLSGELNELRAFKASVPWEALGDSIARGFANRRIEDWYMSQQPGGRK